MVYIRSFIFNSLFYCGTAVLVVVMGPLLLMPAVLARQIARFWGWLAHKQLFVVGVRQRLHGNLQLDKQMIYAVKHQSAWETIILSWLLRAPAFVLKVELLRLPIIGLFFVKTGCIPVDRSDGMRALRKMRDAALELAQQGRSMIIFPQGTRVAPGDTKPYEIGVFALYDATSLPVVPVALNSGHVWPRNSWLKYPGCVDVHFLEPIPPGLTRKVFMATLDARIEDKMAELDTSSNTIRP
jgi:1-acyl-sn-glycerol-3-phosphate acyltransferase